MRISSMIATLALLGMPATATASSGVGDPIYGAKLYEGLTEFELRHGRLTGCTANGEDGLVFELEHAFSSRLTIAGLVETGRQSENRRAVNALAAEAIYTTGRTDALELDTAVYAEFKHGQGEPDAIELNGLLEHQAGAFDSRLNIIGERPLRSGDPIELSYAASADWALIGDEIRLGVAAFGDLGTSSNLGGRQEHYFGPAAKFEIEHVGRGKFAVELGYLRAFGAARDRTDGQVRVLIGYEARF